MDPKTVHMTTELQNALAKDAMTPIYFVETRDCDYQAESLTAAMHLWASYRTKDTSNVRKVGKVG